MFGKVRILVVVVAVTAAASAFAQDASQARYCRRATAPEVGNQLGVDPVEAIAAEYAHHELDGGRLADDI